MLVAVKYWVNPLQSGKPLIKAMKPLPVISALLLSSMLGGVFNLAAHADTVYLSQNRLSSAITRRVDGQIVKMNNDQIFLRTADGKITALNRSLVRSISFSNKTATPEPPAPAAQDLPSILEPGFQPVHLSPMPTPSNANPFPELEQRVVVGARNLAFPDITGQSYDERHFIPLSTFVGGQSKRVYAGMYYFQEKGTFWVRLPEIANQPKQLKFTLFGKLNKNQPTENFRVQARFIDAYGQAIGESAEQAFELVSRPRPIEWFDQLDGTSGIGGQVEVFWLIPEDTKTIEFRVVSADTPNRHLVGYLGDIVVIEP